MSSFKVYPKSPTTPTTRSSKGPTFPMIAPKAMSIGGRSETLLIDYEVESETVAMKDRMPEWLKEKIELDDDRIQEESVSESAPGVTLNEGH